MGAPSRPREKQDDELTTELQSFRRGRAPILLAIIANVVLSALLLGLPYLRGQQQAKDARVAFAKFSACLFDAQPAPEPGLSLPAGERIRFADRVLREPPGWLSRCDSALQAIAPEQAIFLWPAVKTAGADLREGVRRFRGELRALASKTPSALPAVPERPLLVFSRMRAALTLFIEAGGATDGMDRDAIVWRRPPQGEPARLPIMAAQWSPTRIWSQQGYLEASAIDRRGLSWLRLEDDGLKRRRPRTSSLVRGTLLDDAGLQVIWATPEARCETLEDRCSHHATGFARFDNDSDQLPQPRWLAGHPLGRIDRSLRLGSNQVTLIARMESTQEVALRTFSRHGLGATEGPLAPTSERILTAPGPIVDALLLPDADADHGPLWLWVKGDDSMLGYYVGPDGLAADPAVTLPGKEAWASACAGNAGAHLAVGTEKGLRLLRTASPVAADPARPPAAGWTSLYEQTLALWPEALGSDPSQDRVRLLCDGDAIALVYQDARQTVWTVRCSEEGKCGPAERAVKGAATYDALLQGEDLWLAYSLSHDGQIRLKRNQTAPIAPSPCFAPRKGLCGQPQLLLLQGNLIVTAREGSDLLAVMSPDDGQSFDPLPGLQGAVLPSDNSALQQHRLRKGMRGP